MQYDSYKKKYPEDVLVYIEEFNRNDRTVLFDFIDSNEYQTFNDTLNRESNLETPTMVFLSNYRGKSIRENTIYAIKRSTVESLQLFFQNTSDTDSYLIKNRIELNDLQSEIFTLSVSLGDFIDYIYNYRVSGGENIADVDFPKQKKISVVIRNIGQGNWNEINFNDQTMIVYDAGAPMHASRASVLSIIGNRNSEYSQSKPILILSHWDKDHYHSLLGMSNIDLANNFKFFICRDRLPNLTSRLLFSRIRTALGNSKILTITADPRTGRGGPTLFRNINPTNRQIVIYNAQHHKNRNISGIAMTVKTSKNSIILSGDAHYDQISRDILPHLNFNSCHHLVVPHHGGCAGRYLYANPGRLKYGRAIISVGRNSYGHPFPANISYLITDGFKVERTNYMAADITVNL